MGTISKEINDFMVDVISGFTVKTKCHTLLYKENRLILSIFIMKKRVKKSHC